MTTSPGGREVYGFIMLSISKSLAKHSILLKFQVLPGLDDNQGLTSNLSGRHRAGSRNTDCGCCYINPSHAISHDCIEKRQDLLCKSSWKDASAFPVHSRKSMHLLLFVHAVLMGVSKQARCKQCSRSQQGFVQGVGPMPQPAQASTGHR